jgi:hypothetical protein
MRRLFTKRKLLLLAALLINVVQNAQCDISVSTNDLTIQLDHTDVFFLQIRNYTGDPALLHFDVQHTDLISVSPSSVEVRADVVVNVTVKATGAGHSEVVANISNPAINTNNAYVRVTVNKIPGLDTFSLVVGWVYFVAWSVSFYPQIYINFKRKRCSRQNFSQVVHVVLLQRRRVKLRLSRPQSGRFHPVRRLQLGAVLHSRD